MTQEQRYLAEEVAEDHVDGIITRREAMRRLGLLGLSVPAATAMLTGFAEGAAAKGGRGRGGDHPRGPAAVNWAPVATEAITFPGPATPLLGAWAPAADPVGGVLVIHENRGLTDHIRTVASRFAGSGYSALALDLLSRYGGTAAFPGDGAPAAKLGMINPVEFDQDMQAAVTELLKRVPRKRVAAIGFCFGGMMVWRLLAAGEKRLSAAAPFYGPFPTGGDLRHAKAAVLGVYGGLDTRVNDTRPAAEAALKAAKLKYQLLTFTQADHAFFNDTGTRYNLAAAAEAYRRALGWYGKFVADDHDHGRH